MPVAGLLHRNQTPCPTHRHYPVMCAGGPSPPSGPALYCIPPGQYSVQPIGTGIFKGGFPPPMSHVS